MCWSIVLMCLYETAVAEAKESRKEAKPAENKPESDSDVVNMTVSPAQETKDNLTKKKETIKANCQSKLNNLLAYHCTWIDQVICDANCFATNSNPRLAKIIDNQILSQSTNDVTDVNGHTLALIDAFNKNLWLQLRSRG